MNMKKEQIIYGCLVATAVYIFFGWPKEGEAGWSQWVPLLLIGIAFFAFMGNFIDKENVREMAPAQDIGPQEPFTPSKMEYDIDPVTKNPIRKITQR